MKEEITGGLQEMKTKQDKLPLIMKEDITMGFQEMKINRNGGYSAKIF